MKQIIVIASALAMMAAGTGQLPKIVLQIRLAQLEILKATQAKSWGTPWIPK